MIKSNMRIISTTSKKIINFVNLCKSQSFHLDRQRLFLLLRYLFAGGLSFITNIGLLFVFTAYLNLWYLTASTFAFIISVIVSFLAQKYITFRDISTNRITYQMTQYIAIAIFNVIANAIIVFILVDFIRIIPLLAQIISAGFIAVWSLFVYRFIIFHKTNT
jgi:dolichol-phosphate mannosyltransferase